MIPDIETEIIYFSDLLRTDIRFSNTCQQITKILDSLKLPNKYLPNTRDIWVRDYMPIQISTTDFLEYRYDPDYLQGKKYRKIKSYPGFICESINLITKKIDVILDGGNLVKSTDCVILTDKVIEENKCFYEPNKLIERLKEDFKVDKVVLVPWDKEEDYLGHADGMMRFINNDTVLMQGFYKYSFKQKIFKLLEKNRLQWELLKFDVKEEDERSWAYLNFLQTKDLILIPSFGIDEDEQALDQISKYFPDYKKKEMIKQVDLSEIVKEGGSLNCISWTVKK